MLSLVPSQLIQVCYKKMSKAVNFTAASLETPYSFSLTFITNKNDPLKDRPSERLNFCKKSKD